MKTWLLLFALQASLSAFGNSKSCSSLFSWVPFQNSRGLHEYKSLLHPDFPNSLKRLSSQDFYLDLGSGNGVAAQEFLASFPQTSQAPNVYLVTCELGFFRRVPTFQGRLKWKVGRLWEEIPDHELPVFQLVTDVFGVISYTRDLSLTLQKVFLHLEVGGELYLHSYNPAIQIEVGGNVIGLTQFLRSLSGLKVEGQFGILKITKQSAVISIPQLKLISYEASSKPPMIRYRLR